MAVGHVTDLGSSLVVGRMARQFLPAVMEVVIAYPIMITCVLSLPVNALFFKEKNHLVYTIVSSRMQSESFVLSKGFCQ